MSGYLNNFVGYVLNLFKKENRENHRDTSIYGTPPRQIKRIYESCEKKWSDTNLGLQYFPYNGGLPKDYSPYLSPSPRLRDYRERCSGLRRSSSMDFLSSSEDRSWLHNRKKISNHQSPDVSLWTTSLPLHVIWAEHFPPPQQILMYHWVDSIKNGGRFDEE
ncbi:hypothetical protein CEXT_742301, partial [Caerostris extrusa]